MNASTLESLPNELLLSIFRYLSSFDLCQAFLNVNNTRIERLLTSMHHTLDVSTMRYGQLRRFLNNLSEDSTKRFTALIDAIVLRDSSGCATLAYYWKKTINDMSQSHIMFPSIEKLFVLNADDYEPGLIEILSSPLVSDNGRLQYLHVVFKKLLNSYLSMLSDLVTRRISVHTMILEVEKGMLNFSIKNSLDLA